jgi:hypothetical protein
VGIGEFGGVRQGGVDMLGPQGGIATQNLLASGAFRETIENDRDWDACAHHTDIAATNLRVARKIVLPNDHLPIITTPPHSVAR